MSSLKDDATPLHKSILGPRVPGTQIKYDMSVTLPVSHVEIWPYVASAVAASETHALAAVLIFQLAMMLPVCETSQSPVLVSHFTPQYVEEHGVYQNAYRSTSPPTHQPRSWSKAEAE
jgi:hypothetical protein